ncbi:MAG: response regulator transcription factor [Kaistella sp.]
MKTEIVLFDNHYLYLEALCCLLNKNGFDKIFNYQCTVDVDELEDMVTEKSEIAILNIIGLSATDAFCAVEKLMNLHPRLKIIILSPHPEVKMIKKYFDKGVKSFLSRHTDAAEFVLALNEVIDGKVFITEEIKNHLYNFICNVEDQNEKRYGIKEELTIREKEVLDLICEGYRTKEIADKLFISPHTVESHRRNIMLKLDVRNSSMLVKFAVDNHLVN